MKALMLLTLPAAMLFANTDASAESAKTREHSGKTMQIDRNQDGVISKDEATGTRLAERFAQLDKDQNGSLSKDELAAGRPHHRGGKRPSPEAHFKNLDTNGNGSLEKSELAGKRFVEHFDEIDANRDGSLTKAEMTAAWKAKAAQRRDPQAHFKALDTNGDGRLSTDEVAGKRIAGHFTKLDANGDGALTQDELRAAHGKHGGKGRGVHTKDGKPEGSTARRPQGSGQARRAGANGQGNTARKPQAKSPISA